MKIDVTTFLQPSFWLHLFQVFIKSCQRFPLTILCVISFTLLALWKNHDVELLTDIQWQRGMLMAITGAFWFLAAGLFSENHHLGILKKFGFSLFIFALICWQISSNDSLAISSWTLLFAVMLAVSFAAYLFRSSDNASIWYFNFQLIAGLCFAMLSTLILCGGLSLILKSIEYLFEIKIDHKFYEDIWLIGSCFFAPAYFLTNVPEQFNYQRSDCEFPRGVHFIQNYVLAPLSLVFMVILYAYFIKILLQWELPRGNLGKMISLFGVIGIFTHLTIYPVHDRGAPLLSWFYRNFYKMMVVPLGLLILAITVRVSQYGLTEPRYIVVICAIWFVLLIAYNMIKGSGFQLKNVTVILTILVLIASFGSWRIDKLPVQDQFSRLQSLLIKQNLLIDNQYIAPKTQPDFETRKSISSIVSYLLSHGGSHMMRPWFSDQKAFDEIVDCDGRKCRNYDGSSLVKHMSIDFINRWDNQEDDRHFNISFQNQLNRGPFGNNNILIPIDNFDYIIPISIYQNNNSSEQIVEQPWLTKNINHINISLINNKIKVTSDDFQKINFNLNILLERLNRNGEIRLEQKDANKLILNQSNQDIKARLLISNIRGSVIDGNKKAESIEGILLLKLIQ